MILADRARHLFGIPPFIFNPLYVSKKVTYTMPDTLEMPLFRNRVRMQKGELRGYTMRLNSLHNIEFPSSIYCEHCANKYLPHRREIVEHVSEIRRKIMRVRTKERYKF